MALRLCRRLALIVIAIWILLVTFPLLVDHPESLDQVSA